MPDSNDTRFAAFWAAYPRREGKIAARRAWDRIKVDDALLQRMITTLAWQCKTRQWLEGFVPHPATWLNQGRWEDEPFEAESALAVAQRPMTTAQARSSNNRDVLARALARNADRGVS